MYQKEKRSRKIAICVVFSCAAVVYFICGLYSLVFTLNAVAINDDYELVIPASFYPISDVNDALSGVSEKTEVDLDVFVNAYDSCLVPKYDLADDIT